jgi:endonuclease/exonuclease/phosphatase family metal-dependent hydrolase
LAGFYAVLRSTACPASLTDRLDHIVYDPRLEPLAADVIYEGRSDHFPVVSVLAPAR